MAELRLCLLGGFELATAAGSALRLSARKARALLAYLALGSAEPSSRERLAALLWEEAGDAAGRSSLRQALASLRRDLPAAARDLVVADAERIKLDARLLAVDVREFRSALAEGTRGALEHALLLYRGELLAGFAARSGAFDDWVRGERAALRRQAAGAVARLHAMVSALGDDIALLDVLLRWVELEPFDEEPRRALMELHARRGHHAEALEEYRRLREALRRELDLAPEPATEALEREILRRRRLTDVNPSAPSPAPAPRAPIESLRVSDAPRSEGLCEATVLVARLGALGDPRSALDAEQAGRIALSLVSSVETVVAALGSAPPRSVGSDVVAVFGLEALRGDEAERAVRAALALAAVVERQPWPAAVRASLRVGLSQGQVVLGRDGDRQACAGRPVSVALALAALAGDGEVLASEELARTLGQRLIGARQVTAEGDATLVRALRSSAEPGSGSVFVGRRAELALARSLLEGCLRTERGQALLLRGEAGIGKSRLLGELASLSRELGFRVHGAHALEFGQASPGRPIAALTLSLLGVRAELAPAERAAVVTQAAAAGLVAPEDVLFLGELVEAAIGEQDRPLQAALDLASRQRGRAAALRRLLARASARDPLCVLVDDVHWIDAEERACLAELAAAAASARALLVLTARPDSEVFDAGWRVRAPGCALATVDLGSLGAGEARALAAQHPGLGPELVESCLERAEGLPLFLDQLLRAAAAGQRALPASIRASVLLRLERLPPTRREVVHAVAVLGQRASLAAAAFVLACEIDASALSPAALLHAEGDELVFGHALFRDAVYDSLLCATRQSLHARAARWFLERDPLLSAQHLEAAGDAGTADAYLRAARSDAAAQRVERAQRSAERAREIARDPGTVHAASALLGELRLHAGRIAEALVAFREALELAPDELARGAAWVGVAGVLRVQDRYEEALDALERAEKCWRAADDARLAELWTLRGNVFFPVDLGACLRAHEQARVHAVAAGSKLLEARALGGLGDGFYQRGRMRTACGYFAACVEECRSEQRLGLLLAYLPMLALTRAYAGELAAALDDCREARGLAERVGSPRAELLVCIVASSLHGYRAEYAEALALAERALELGRGLGARRFEAEASALVGAALLGLGRRDDATAALSAALELCRAGNAAYCGPYAAALFALATRDPEERARALAEGGAVLAEGAVGSSAIDFYAGAIEASLAVGDAASARRYADSLEASTAEEPVLWSDLLVRRARLLADTLAPGDAGAAVELAELADAIRASGFLGLLPAVEAAV